MLDQLQGYRTKIAAIVLAVLAANEVYQFLPAQYIQAIVYLAGGAGLFFLREAFDNLKNKVSPPDQPAAPVPTVQQQPIPPSGPSQS